MQTWATNYISLKWKSSSNRQATFMFCQIIILLSSFGDNYDKSSNRFQLALVSQQSNSAGPLFRKEEQNGSEGPNESPGLPVTCPNSRKAWHRVGWAGTAGFACLGLIFNDSRKGGGLACTLLLCRYTEMASLLFCCVAYGGVACTRKTSIERKPNYSTSFEGERIFSTICGHYSNLSEENL